MIFGVPSNIGISLPNMNNEKLNWRLFSFWIMVTIVLRNSFESLHPVFNDGVQDLFGMAVTISLIASSNSSRDQKNVPCRQCLTCAKRKRSDDARSSEYGEGAVNLRTFSAQKFDICDMCEGLHVCVNHEFLPSACDRSGSNAERILS
jgi:hypothetical protein